MALNESQTAQVVGWITDGLKLAEIQKRLDTELGVRLTYMEVRLLVDDLKLVPKDQEPTKAVEATVLPAPPPGKPGAETALPPAQAPSEAPAEPQPNAGGVKITVDQVTRPGALVSGSVTFSDHQKAMWYLDQMGRLGMAPNQKGYRPSQEDLAEFQMTLEQELARQGM